MVFFVLLFMEIKNHKLSHGFLCCSVLKHKKQLFYMMLSVFNFVLIKTTARFTLLLFFVFYDVKSKTNVFHMVFHVSESCESTITRFYMVFYVLLLLLIKRHVFVHGFLCFGSCQTLWDNLSGLVRSGQLISRPFWMVCAIRFEIIKNPNKHVNNVCLLM